MNTLVYFCTSLYDVVREYPLGSCFEPPEWNIPWCLLLSLPVFRGCPSRVLIFERFFFGLVFIVQSFKHIFTILILRK